MCVMRIGAPIRHDPTSVELNFNVLRRRFVKILKSTDTMRCPNNALSSFDTKTSGFERSTENNREKTGNNNTVRVKHYVRDDCLLIFT